MTGYQGKSRYDVDVALYAAMAAVVVGVEQVRLRRSYNLAKWARHFTSEEDANLWVRKRVQVTIITDHEGGAYGSMTRCWFWNKEAEVLVLEGRV